jgi:hypothetical protein
MCLYVNGLLAAISNVQSGAIQYPNEGTFAIGAYVNKPDIYPLRGALDDVALWDRAVGQDAVATMYATHRDSSYFCCPLICPVGKVSSGTCQGDVRVDCVPDMSGFLLPCPNCSAGMYVCV